MAEGAEFDDVAWHGASDRPGKAHPQSPSPGWQHQQVLDGVPGADRAALLLNRGGQGPANTSVIAPVEGQFAARLGVTESGEQPNGTNAE